MLDVIQPRRRSNCAGASRRDFLRVGSLGLGSLGAGPLAGAGLGLGGLLRSRAASAASGVSTKDTSVIWLWLGGGPTHVETFDPKMTAPAEYRSVTGEVATNLPGVTLGGTFEIGRAHV